jgi:hypothetical protein
MRGKAQDVISVLIFLDVDTLFSESQILLNSQFWQDICYGRRSYDSYRSFQEGG